MMILRLAFALLFPVLLIAQGTSTGGSVLKLPQHALTASLSDLAVLERGRLEAAGVNPAAMGSAEPTTFLAFTHAAWIQEISGQRLGLSFPTSAGRFSASVAISMIPGIEVRDAPGPAISTFDAQTAAFQVGWASAVLDGIVAGISASYLYEKLYLSESTGLSLDAGVLSKTPIEDLEMGVSVVNLGGMSAFRSESVDLPSTFRLAAGYTYSAGPFVFRPAATYRVGLNHEDSGMTVGGTLVYDGIVGIRGSWRTGETARSVALGFTAAYRGIGLEYALVPFSSGLGTAQVLTFGVSF